MQIDLDTPDVSYDSDYENVVQLSCSQRTMKKAIHRYCLNHDMINIKDEFPL